MVQLLCDYPSGLEWLLRKVKQDINSCKVPRSFTPLYKDLDQDIHGFLKRRAQIEEEYGKQMLKLAQSVMEGADKTDGKRG